MNNYSKQREVILDVIKNNRIHPTAEKIYNLVIKEDAKISKSTVYRNINLLVEQGVIQTITMARGPDRYDYIHKQHNHAICIKCGKIIDFEYNFKSNQLQRIIKTQTGIDTYLNTVIVEGICENCK